MKRHYNAQRDNGSLEHKWMMKKFKAQADEKTVLRTEG